MRFSSHEARPGLKPGASEHLRDVNDRSPTSGVGLATRQGPGSLCGCRAAGVSQSFRYSAVAVSGTFGLTREPVHSTLVHSKTEGNRGRHRETESEISKTESETERQVTQIETE